MIGVLLLLQDLDRIVEEYAKGGTRASIALQALRAHGAAACEALRAAKQPELALELAEDPGDREVREKLRNISISTSFRDTTLASAVQRMVSILEIRISHPPTLGDKPVTAEIDGLNGDQMLQAVLRPLKLQYAIREGAIVISDKPVPPWEGYAPVRLPVADAARKEIAKLVGELGDDSLDAREAALRKLEALGAIGGSVGLPIVSIGENDETSLQVCDVKAADALHLAVRPRGLRYHEFATFVLVREEGWAPVRTRFRPQPALWVRPSIAAKIAAGDFKGLDFDAIPALRWAQDRVEPDVAKRYEAAARAILEDTPGWFPDEASAYRRQGKKLEKPIDVSADGLAGALEAVGKAAGVRIDLRARAAKDLSVVFKSVRADDALDALTLPLGLDYAEVEGVIVVDEAAKIRALTRP